MVSAAPVVVMAAEPRRRKSKKVVSIGQECRESGGANAILEAVISVEKFGAFFAVLKCESDEVKFTMGRITRTVF